ncbi:MAG: hypothetical protein ACREC9_15685 [Methylocella sp.]
MWNRSLDKSPIPHFPRGDPHNLDAANARLAQLRKSGQKPSRHECFSSFYKAYGEAARFYTAGATTRGISRDALIRLLLLEIAAGPHLLDNILDDRGGAE